MSLVCENACLQLLILRFCMLACFCECSPPAHSVTGSLPLVPFAFFHVCGGPGRVGGGPHQRRLLPYHVQEFPPHPPWPQTGQLGGRSHSFMIFTSSRVALFLVSGAKTHPGRTILFVFFFGMLWYKAFVSSHLTIFIISFIPLDPLWRERIRAEPPVAAEDSEYHNIANIARPESKSTDHPSVCLCVCVCLLGVRMCVRA